MSDEPRWTTALTSVDATRVLVRGYPIDELMGRVSFADAIYLLTTGDLPTPSITRLLDALLVGGIDHGAVPASTREARRAARAGASLGSAVAAGVLGFDRAHATAVKACRDLLETGLDSAGSGQLFGSSAVELVEHLVQTDQIPPPGFGHREHTADPRVTRLLQVALDLGFDSIYSQYLRAIEHALSRHPALAEERWPVNIAGAIAAVSADLGLDATASEGLAIVARIPGLVAHVLEERTRPSAVALDVGTAVYDGPRERRFRDRR
jgi:citrate synthase